MRRNPTEPENRLWRALSNGQLAGHKFLRQSVIGPYIADFLCPQKALIVEVDGGTHDADRDRRRDDALAGYGFRVLRVTNSDVMGNLDGVLTAILGALNEASGRWERPHPNPSPEGEGLSSGAARGLLGISLDGSVGKFDGMTINERLVEAGLMDQFDRAGKARDRKQINAILAKVDLWQDASGMNWSKENNAQNP